MRWLSALGFVFILFHLNLISQQYRYLKSAEQLFQEKQTEKGLFDIGQCLRLQTWISPFTTTCKLLSQQHLPEFPRMHEYIQTAEPELIPRSEMDPKPFWEWLAHGSFFVFILAIVFLLIKEKESKPQTVLITKCTAGFTLLLWFLGGLLA